MNVGFHKIDYTGRTKRRGSKVRVVLFFDVLNCLISYNDYVWLQKGIMTFVIIGTYIQYHSYQDLSNKKL